MATLEMTLAHVQGYSITISESMRSDLFEFGMACSENKLEVSFSGAGCEPSTLFN
jgi:hypothetical protein